MKFSFLLVNFNMAGLVGQVVRNLSEHFECGSQYEILIADNSSDELGRLTASSLPSDIPVRIFRIENSGLVDALNFLIPLATAEYVMIMHPDVELAAGCVKALRTFLENNPRAGVVGADLYYPDGSPNKIRLQFPTVTTEAKRIANILPSIVARRKLFRDEVLWDRKSDVSVQTVMSVCMLFRGEVLRKVSPIDPHLVFYYANDFLCWKMQQLGWTCHYTLSARAIHYERFTPRQLYADSKVMEYKRCPIAANPRMRADYFQFLSHSRWLGSRIVLHGLALIEDTVQLAAQFRRPRQGKQNIQQLAESIRVDLNFGRPSHRPVPSGGNLGIRGT